MQSISEESIMDVSDINKIASRKRLNSNAEQLREKVSRETAKIIKLKVAQDTAYWDLKEKLQQVQRNHERLQQNMVEVQMQHETVSAQYQQELRLRPDALNKLNGTRKICDVLEDYSERLRRTLTRCRDDQAALADAYAQCGRRVHALAQSSQLATRTAAATTRQLGEARARAQIAHEAKLEIASQLAKRDEQLSALQLQRTECSAEAQRLARELDARRDDWERERGNYQRLLQEVRDEARAIDAQARELASRHSVVNTELQEAKDKQREQAVQLKEAERVFEAMKNELTVLGDEKSGLENTIENRDKNIHELETEIKSLKEQMSAMEAEKLEVLQQKQKVDEESNVKTVTIQQMTNNIQDLEKKMADMELTFKSQCDQHTEQINTFNEKIASYERENISRAGTINGLIADLKAKADAESRADTALTNLRRQAEAERDAASARDTANAESIRRLEVTIATKDEELRGQMSIIVEMRSEKERLQEKIRGMQSTIDNIQKELTGRLNKLTVTGEVPERDSLPPPTSQAKRSPPPDIDDSLYNFMSDNSVDGDALDPQEVGRRFAALARNAKSGAMHRAPTPISLSQVKQDLKMKNRVFFKNKRLDTKTKKLK